MGGYKIVASVGRGAGSTIYKVQCQKTQEIYALKRVRIESDPGGYFFRQVRTEFRVGSRLSHDGVRRVHKLRAVRRRLKVVELRLIMEWLDGRTLERLGVLAPATLIRIFNEVAEGLKALHNAGYVHADIKPNNIMRMSQDRIKIFDLGQASPLYKVKRRIQGTPDFIAPEQVLRLPLDERTDIFNMGTSMYWCLTGRFYPTRIKGTARSNAIDLGSTRHVESPQELNPAIPLVLSNLVMDCCRNSPNIRPANMSVFLQRLREVDDVLARLKRQ